MHPIVFQLLSSLVATVTLELLAALLLQVSAKKQLATVALMNCATNPVVVLTMAMIPFTGAYGATMYVLAAMELFAVVCEGIVYRLCRFKRPFLLSFALNCASYFGTVLLRKLFVLL